MIPADFPMIKVQEDCRGRRNTAGDKKAERFRRENALLF